MVYDAEPTINLDSVDIKRLAIVSTGWNSISSEIPAIADPRILFRNNNEMLLKKNKNTQMLNQEFSQQAETYLAFEVAEICTLLLVAIGLFFSSMLDNVYGKMYKK